MHKAQRSQRYGQVGPHTSVIVHNHEPEIYCEAWMTSLPLRSFIGVWRLFPRAAARQQRAGNQSPGETIRIKVSVLKLGGSQG